MDVVRGYAGLGIMQMVARQVVMEICEKRSELNGKGMVGRSRPENTVCRGLLLLLLGSLRLGLGGARKALLGSLDLSLEGSELVLEVRNQRSSVSSKSESLPVSLTSSRAYARAPARLRQTGAVPH